MKSNITYILFLGLAVTFWSNALTAFFNPGEFNDVIHGSKIFAPILDQYSLFIFIIGFHDLFISLLLGTQLFRKFATTWAAIWIGIVTVVFFTHGNFEGSFSALEHGAPFAVALYLAIMSFRQKDMQNEAVEAATAKLEAANFKEESKDKEDTSSGNEEIPVPAPPEPLPEPPAPPKDDEE